MKRSSHKVINNLKSVKSSTVMSIKDMECTSQRMYIDGRFHGGGLEGSQVRNEVGAEPLDKSQMIAANLCFLTVQDMISLGGSMPMIEVPPPPNKPKTGDEFATFIKQVLYGTLSHSGGVSLLYNMDYFRHGLGWCLYGVVPNPEDRRVDFRVYDPAWVYPLFKFGSNSQELREVYISWQESKDTVADMFGNRSILKASNNTDADSPDDKCQVTIYYNDQQKMVFIDDEFILGVNHNYGFVPFVIIPNMLASNGLGISDIAQAVGLNIEINKLLALYHEVLTETIRNPLVVTGYDKFPAHQQIGKDSVYLLPEGDAKRLPPIDGNLPEVSRIINYYENTYGALTGTGSSRRGELRGQYASEGGQKALQEPVGDRVDAGNRLKGERMSIANEMALKMLQIHYPHTKMSVYGAIGRASFMQEFTGNKIEDYYYNTVWFLPSVMSSAADRDVRLMQQQQAGWISQYTARVQSGTSDPDFEREKIIEETKEQAKLQLELESMRMQQLQEAPPSGVGQAGLLDSGGAAGPPVDFEKQAQALAAGRTNPTAEGLFGGASPAEAGAMSGGEGGPPLALPTGGPAPDTLGLAAGPEAGPAAQTMPGAEPQGVIPKFTTDEEVGVAERVDLRTLANRIRDIENIHGQVFLLGRIVEFGDTTQDIEIGVNDKTDKQTILNALPDLAGRIKWNDRIPAGGTPVEPYVEVTPGTQGYKGQGEEFALEFQDNGMEPYGPLPGGNVPKPTSINEIPE